MKRLTVGLALAALASLGITTHASAQGMTCADITFIDAVYERWSFADEGCLELVTRDDGNVYARFEAEILAQTPSGTYLRYKLNDGTKTERRKANPPEGFQVTIDGKPMTIAELMEGQVVRIYLPEQAWLHPEPAAAAAPMPAPAPAPAPEPAPEPEPMPVMPATAGSLGWLGVFGALFLALGGALRFARR